MDAIKRKVNVSSEAENPSSTPPVKKIKLKTPKAPRVSRKRSIVSSKRSSTLFYEWMKQWRKMNTKYTTVQATIHSTSNDDKNNFLMLTQKSFKNGSTNKILLHYKILPEVIEQIQSISQQLFNLHQNTHEESNQDTFIDEWDLNSPQSVYRKELARVYAKIMSENILELSRKFCEGCNFDYPSQRDHDCLMMDVEAKIETFYWLLFENVDGDHANEFCYGQLKNTDENLANQPTKLCKDLLRTDEDWTNKVKEILKDLLENN